MAAEASLRKPIQEPVPEESAVHGQDDQPASAATAKNKPELGQDAPAKNRVSV